MAADELAFGTTADGTPVPYVLTTGGGKPAYAVVLMPGGNGTPLAACGPSGTAPSRPSAKPAALRLPPRRLVRSGARPE